ncbi:terminase small subunit [Tistrella mobilis KA081020-065]|uniref:Terminase small subunit n=1 Tax=Tistrella mobilis (strain KA081020-065) TaxID=1110502 RepID=I3TN84_TISMK|nr:terminase small subunit [Tistrella mobilis KA081020-065]
MDRLPPEILDAIRGLRQRGHTIDEIRSHLDGLGVTDVSRSGLGVYIKRLDELRAQTMQARSVAEAVVDRLGDDADDDVMNRASIELLQGLILKVSLAGAGDGAALDPKELMMLSSAIKNAASARKVDADRVLQAEKRAADKARREAADRAGAAAKARGLTPDTAAFIREQILGVT